MNIVSLFQLIIFKKGYFRFKFTGTGMVMINGKNGFRAEKKTDT